MRTDYEWLVALGRQADRLAASVDYLFACRDQGYDDGSALAVMREDLARYRATLEAAPLRVVTQHAFEHPNSRQGR